MPGGTGAGTILGVDLFLILFNNAGPAANTVGIGRQISRPLSKRKPILKSKVKWIDQPAASMVSRVQERRTEALRSFMFGHFGCMNS